MRVIPYVGGADQDVSLGEMRVMARSPKHTQEVSKLHSHASDKEKISQLVLANGVEAGVGGKQVQLPEQVGLRGRPLSKLWWCKEGVRELKLEGIPHWSSTSHKIYGHAMPYHIVQQLKLRWNGFRGGSSRLTTVGILGPGTRR